LKKIYYNTRSTKINCPGRFRIITNRSRPDEKNPSVFNENGAKEVVDFIHKEMSSRIPILMYVGSLNTVSLLTNSLATKNYVRDPYSIPTNAPLSVDNFVLMSTVLFIWRDLENNPGTKKLLNHYMDNGVVCICRDSDPTNFDTYAESFLHENPDLKYNPRFRVVTSRYNSEFIKKLRDLHFKCPVLVYTSDTGIPDATQKFSNSQPDVFISAKEEEAKDFGVLKWPLDKYKDLMEYKPVLNLHESLHGSPFAVKKSYDSPVQDTVAFAPSNVSAPSKPVTKSNSNSNSPQVPKEILKGEVYIKKLSGKDLASKDSNGKSDPYVIFRSNQDIKNVIRTPHIKKTLNPSWTNFFRLKDITSNGSIHVEVWDKDFIGNKFTWVKN